MNETAHSPEALDRLARRRAGVKLGFYIHALVYILVNVLLAFLSGMSGRHWAVFPALGWGLGLMIHGLVVFLAMPGGGLFQQLMARERASLERQYARDPW
jgi:hypothetical protein